MSTTAGRFMCWTWYEEKTSYAGAAAMAWGRTPPTGTRLPLQAEEGLCAIDATGRKLLTVLLCEPRPLRRGQDVLPGS